MSWDTAVARANAAIARSMGTTVTYVVGAARRRITATPGDITAVPVQTPRGIVMRSTCLWSVDAAQLEPLLQGQQPKRGQRIEVDNPSSGPVSWTVDFPQPDLVSGAGGWVLSTYYDADVSMGAKGAERMK